jgi:hypothetical protein
VIKWADTKINNNRGNTTYDGRDQTGAALRVPGDKKKKKPEETGWTKALAKRNNNHSQSVGLEGTDQWGFQSNFPVRDNSQKGIDKVVSIVCFCFPNWHQN